MYRNKISSPAYDEFRKRLNNLFRALRKHRLYTRQNFGCCGGCAAYELSNKIRESQDKKTPKQGFVCYNRQNTERLAYGYVFLEYAVLDSTDNQTVELGQIIIREAAKAGLATEWDNSAQTKIGVLAPVLASPLVI